jgi:hypothetical protein
MKVNYLIILLAFAGAMMYSSCDRDELFEREQYKNVFALLSDDGFNIFAEEHALDSTVSTGFISAACGGSMPTREAIHITIVEDEELLLQYNRSSFDVDESKYARWLPRDKYEIADYSITIAAGERQGRMSIKIRPNGLSPDTTYFIPLCVDRFDKYELNPKKSNVLYRVFLKNYYTTNKTDTYYNTRGKLGDANVTINKQVYPTGKNSVRTMAGDISILKPNLEELNNGAMLLTVDENDSVRIEAWRDLDITQVNGDPDYPNTFSVYDDGYKTYKTFLLRYDYVYDGKNYSMQEELRLEFREENKY